VLGRSIRAARHLINNHHRFRYLVCGGLLPGEGGWNGDNPAEDRRNPDLRIRQFIAESGHIGLNCRHRLSVASPPELTYRRTSAPGALQTVSSRPSPYSRTSTAKKQSTRRSRNFRARSRLSLASQSPTTSREPTRTRLSGASRRSGEQRLHGRFP
jgi:hypothetical protein